MAYPFFAPTPKRAEEKKGITKRKLRPCVEQLLKWDCMTTKKTKMFYNVLKSGSPLLSRPEHKTFPFTLMDFAKLITAGLGNIIIQETHPPQPGSWDDCQAWPTNKYWWKEHGEYCCACPLDETSLFLMRVAIRRFRLVHFRVGIVPAGPSIGNQFTAGVGYFFLPSGYKEVLRKHLDKSITFVATTSNGYRLEGEAKSHCFTAFPDTKLHLWKDDTLVLSNVQGIFDKNGSRSQTWYLMDKNVLYRFSGSKDTNQWKLSKISSGVFPPRFDPRVSLYPFSGYYTDGQLHYFGEFTQSRLRSGKICRDAAGQNIIIQGSFDVIQGSFDENGYVIPTESNTE